MFRVYRKFFCFAIKFVKAGIYSFVAMRNIKVLQQRQPTRTIVSRKVGFSTLKSVHTVKPTQTKCNLIQSKALQTTRVQSTIPRSVVNFSVWNPKQTTNTVARYTTSANTPATPSYPSQLTPSNKRSVTKELIMPIDEYARQRSTLLKLRREIKKDRQIHIGPNATLTFSNYELMWFQIQEMLFVEKGGEAQLEDELAAYNPLIPDGSNWKFTLFLEFPDVSSRYENLSKLGRIEDQVYLSFESEQIKAESSSPEIERTNAAGKTSAVHFLQFNFTPEQIHKIKNTTKPITMEIKHENYGHACTLPKAVLSSLRSDLA